MRSLFFLLKHPSIYIIKSQTNSAVNFRCCMCSTSFTTGVTNTNSCTMSHGDPEHDVKLTAIITVQWSTCNWVGGWKQSLRWGLTWSPSSIFQKNFQCPHAFDLCLNELKRGTYRIVHLTEKLLSLLHCKRRVWGKGGGEGGLSVRIQFESEERTAGSDMLQYMFDRTVTGLSTAHVVTC